MSNNDTNSNRISHRRGLPGLFMVIALMAVTLYMAFAFPYTLMQLKQTETTVVKSVIIVGLSGEVSPSPESYFVGEAPPRELHNIGSEQLTNVGKERMYLLGKFLKLRYYQLLLNGDPRKVYARSADADRYLESAQQLLAGFNPPRNDWIWSTSTGELSNWQPKAVHTTESAYDDLLAAEVNCFRLEQEKNKWKNSSRYQQLINEFRHDLQTLRSNTGLEFEDDLELATDLEEALRTRKAFKDDVPAWYTSTLAARLAHIADVSTGSRFNAASVQRFYVGRLLHEITENINTKIMLHQMSSPDERDVERKLPRKSKAKALFEPNIYLYLTDKLRMSALLSSLQIYSTQPNFGSLLLIELHYDPIKQLYFLRLFTVSSSSPNTFPEPLRVNPIACVDSVECEPQQFEQNIRHLMLDKLSWQEACLNSVPTITPTPRPVTPPLVVVTEEQQQSAAGTTVDSIQAIPTTIAPNSQPIELTTSTSSLLEVVPVTSKPANYLDKLEDNLIVGPTEVQPPEERTAPSSSPTTSSSFTTDSISSATTQYPDSTSLSESTTTMTTINQDEIGTTVVPAIISNAEETITTTTTTTTTIHPESQSATESSNIVSHIEE